MNRRTAWARTLLASVAVASAVALAGCDTDGTSPLVPARAMAPLSSEMVSLLEQKGMPKESPILIRVFKEEAELEVWKQDSGGQYALLKTYPICRWSGELGPKIREGDRQAPEGFYTITPGQMNPNSNYYLSFNIGFPNAYDRANDRTGAFLMVHGDCSSAGCYAMTDEQMGEIYSLGREAFLGGQKSFQIQAYPFHMTPLNLARHRNNPAMAFWRMIKIGNDHFEVSRQEPKVDVCGKHYVFDAETNGHFDPKGRCPTFHVPTELANAVAEKEQRDEREFEALVKRGTAMVAVRTGSDGGMNELFLAKLRSQERLDGGGIFSLASTQHVPAMGNNVNPPRAPGATQMTTASVTQQPAPTTQVASADTSPRSGLGSLFASSGSTMTKWLGLRDDDSQPQTQSQPAPLPKARPTAETRTAAAAPHHAPAATRPAPRSQVAEERKAAPSAQAAAASTPPAGATTTTASIPPASGMIAGAAPVVSSSSFDARWGGFH